MEQEVEYYDEESGEDQIVEEAEGKIRELIEGLNQDPANFELYQELIEIYRKLGMLEELREARERVNALYCLPVEMWLEWLEDEERLMGPKEDPRRMLQLYEKAMKDYRYYKVCKKYCRYILSLYNTDPPRVTEE